MSDKTEAPTDKRQRKARAEGDVAKSVRITATFGGIGWWLLLLAIAPRAFQLAQDLIRTSVELDGTRAFQSRLSELFSAIDATMLPVFLGSLGFGALLVVIPEVAQTRGVFAMKKITPRFEQLNPVNGLKNLFGTKTLVELAMTALQSAVLAFVLVQTALPYIRQLASSYGLSLAAHLAYLAGSQSHLLALVAGSQVAFAGADYFIQRFLWLRRHRMDKHEVKREYRDDEGDGHVKGKRKALHRELSQ